MLLNFLTKLCYGQEIIVAHNEMMNNNYMITEVNEAGIAKRNVTKMKYLLKENRQMKEQIRDYQCLISLNKET